MKNIKQQYTINTSKSNIKYNNCINEKKMKNNNKKQ